jgi:aldose 1-epimerase
LNTAFTDLARDESGRAWVRLEGKDSRRVELWIDDHYPIIGLFTGDTLVAGRRRMGLGVEPMTCPPNAFQTGENFMHLQADQGVTARWGIRLV